jgi:hypothetical protein
VSDAPKEAIDEAARDPEVVAAAKDLLLEVMRHARTVLREGDPSARQAVMRMYAGPIVKEVLNPAASTKKEEVAEIKAALDEFHTLRRQQNN